MNVPSMGVTAAQAYAALHEYKQHRSVYDKRDWQIERIYRAISKGKTVISLNAAIPSGGIDALGRPHLAIMRADQEECECIAWLSEKVVFRNVGLSKSADWYFEIPWANRIKCTSAIVRARLPRIPPQHRPASADLHKYHILWEADWHDLPRDPMLLRRIGKDAWVVVAAWDLTDVELSVLRAHA